MVTWAIHGPRGSFWLNSSMPCDPGPQPSSVARTAQTEQRHPSGQGGAGRADIVPPLPLDTTEPLAFILSLSTPHTHTRSLPHTSLPPPCRDTATSPPRTPPPSPSPPPPSTGCFKQVWAEQIRLMPWETLPGPEPFSSWAIPGLEVARKRK